MLAQLPLSVHAFALSHRGHGDSQRPAEYAVADFVADVDGFLNTVDIERAVIVGHSMSSLIAQRFAHQHPDRTLALVLIGAFASLHDQPVIAELREALTTFTDPIDPEFIREFQESTIHYPVPAEFLATVIEESSKLPAHVWQTTCEGWFTEPDPKPNPEGITVPTLVLWGDHDAYAPHADQELLTNRIPHATLVIYEDTGHALHWEKPDRFTTDLVAFASAHADATRQPYSNTIT